MADVIPTLSEELNTWFTQTWYEIQPETIDNILDATVVSALLKDKNVFRPRRGGDTLTKTIRYGEKTAFVFGKGDVLPVTEEELSTQARWPWAQFAVPITRTFIDDLANSGIDMIKDYVADRLSAARDALVQKLEAILMAESIFVAGSKEPLSIFDYVPSTISGNDYFDTTPFYYGGISRNNTWWQHIDFTAVAAVSSANQKGIKAGPYALTMIEDMKNAYNTTGAQISFPDIIITTQALYESYESFAEAKEQIIRDETTRIANLGFDVLRYRGNPLTWSKDMTANQMLMLNSEFMEVTFDPVAWFEMTSWERPARQLEQVAYIVSRMQVRGWQPRRNCRIKWTA